MASMTALRQRILSPDAEQVLAAIHNAGGRPMLVGGCVRDDILNPGSPAKDIDVEVYGLTFAALAEALSRAGRVDECGKSFGVLKIRAGDTDMDINVPRRERKISEGHRGFEIAPDMELGFAEASGRRDFTMNALLADPETGEVIDCHGGLADLGAGVLRHTSHAFSEDPLRVLRAVQFAARFGFTLAMETANLCRLLAGAYGELPIERVWCEFEKIGARGKNIMAALVVLKASGWERHFPQVAALHGVEQDPEWHPEGDVWVHSGLAANQAARLADEAGLTGTDRFTVVFAALLHDLGKVTHTQRLDGRITSHGHAAAGVEPAQAFLRSIGCPEAVTARILPLVREHMCCMDRPTKPAVRRLVRRLVPSTLTELAIVCGADRAGRGDPGAPNLAMAWLEMGRDLTITERPAKGLLTGDHLIAAGMTPGPPFKPVLAAALEAQDAGEFEDEAGALAWLAAYRATAMAVAFATST
jgi:tRNA nucleotidyltransferase (CCA-adding enzyme)